MKSVKIMISVCCILSCCFASELFAGRLQDKFRKLVNILSPQKVDDMLSKRDVYLQHPKGDYNDLAINAATAKVGLDNLSKKVLEQNVPTPDQKQTFLFNFEEDPAEYLSPAERILQMAVFAKKCGTGNVLRYDEKAHQNCESAKLFDYQTPQRTIIPVTVYSMLDTILKNADLFMNQNRSPSFAQIYNHLDKNLDAAIAKVQ